ISLAVFASVLSANLSPALAADGFTQISALLKQGFEIRASYSEVQDAGRIVRYIILQKGASAYQCTTQYGKYSNGYRCYEILDWESALN
ncbi:MAG: hypothetical protein LBG66_05410, partial [Gallionellaceae bacterium]|nr:hypothetical protein [Gallionellaceae bacterium]